MDGSGPRAPASPDGCHRERADVNQRCGEARDARRVHEDALERLRDLRRRLTGARRAREAAAEAADPRRRRETKDLASERYRAEVATADGDAARAEAAARWARTVDDLNRQARAASRAEASARGVVASLEGELRAAEAHERSLRVTAEAAEAACLESRVRLAACEERLLATAHRPTPAPAAAGASRSPRPAGPADATASPGVAGPGAAIHPAPALPRIGQAATLLEVLLRGERGWLERTASLVAEVVGRPTPEVLMQLRELLDAIGATAGRDGYFVLQGDHDFWSRITAEEARDVLAALARLGFVVDPMEGWHNDRAPVQGDLSMALAYAGLDARSLRRQPSNAELRDLPRSIAVDARALLANEAPDLALDQLVRMLGRRADTLGPLWDDWGHVRPILLSDPRAIA